MFCSAPWTHLFIRPDGRVKTCCAGTVELGNIRKNSIKEIINSSKFSEIKKEISKENWHENCNLCKHNEVISGTSQRFSFQNMGIKKLINKNVDFFHPTFLDIRWNNTCNSSCVYCNEYFSSKWEKVKNKNQTDNNKNHIKDFKEYLYENKNHIKKLWLIGGEPLLIKDNLDLLYNTSDEVQLLLITNLSIPNLEKSAIWHELKKKKNIKWNVSFENVDKKYEWVRHGSKWSDLLKNLDLLTKNYSDVTVAATYNIFCAYDLEPLYNFCKQRHLKIQWSVLSDPKEFDVNNFPKQYKLQAHYTIQKLLEKYDDIELNQIANNLLLNLDNNDTIIKNFKNYVNNLDYMLLKKNKFDQVFENFYI